MAVINVQNWSIEQVVDWITGLDPSLSQYTDEFTSNGISGQRLLNLMPGDLEYIVRIGRIGDQLLLHDAIQTLRDELQTPWTTLQTLSLALSVRCKNYRSELTQQKQRYLEIQAKEAEQAYNAHPHHHHHHHGHHHHQTQHNYNHTTSKVIKNSSSSLLNSSSERGSTDRMGNSNQNTNTPITETIPTTSLASASYLLDAGKVLIRWLTRFPFLGKLHYDEISRKLTKHCFELAVLSQRDTFADNAIEEVQYLCTKIIELCEQLIHNNDSLGIQPAGIDIITLRKRTEQDWGLQFESSYWGLHQITGVKLSSPAQQSGHLERGDEILQVNYQTVLAWPQTSVISLLHENENEVILTVKRRPRHASTNLLLLGGHQNNMYLNKVPNRKSFFERKAKEERASRERTVRQDTTRILLDEVVIEEDEMKEHEKEPEPDKVEEKEQLRVQEPEDEKVTASDVRFWKLYPKPKYLIKRRATVTGASPTDTRPPVTFINDSDSTTQPLVLNHHQNHKSDPTDPPRSNKPHQTVHHRRSTPVTTITCANETSVAASLLHPPQVHRYPLDKSRSAPEQDVLCNAEQPPPAQKAETPPQHDDDEVFATEQPLDTPNHPTAAVKEQTAPIVIPPPPTPKPRLTRTSTSTVPPPPPPQQQQQQVDQIKKDERPEPPPKILHRGILHIRSQLRKQSSSNSASALPVIGPNCSLSNSTSSLMLCSSSPRWIRQNAIFYSNRELEIINPVSSSNRSVSVSNSSALSNQNFRVRIKEHEKPGVIGCDEFSVYAASEVHSRPFAFKITSGDSVTYYLAAESQMELDQWVSVMTTGNVINANTPRNRTSVSNAGDSGRRNFARAPYKRSISLGSSQSPTVSYTNLSTPTHSPVQQPQQQQQQPTSTPTQKPLATPRFYASSQNLSTCSLNAYKQPTRLNNTANFQLYDSPSRTLLNRSKSSSLKTDWFLRNNTPTSSSSPSSSTPQSSNITSIKITSKKVQAATQVPSPSGTPTRKSQATQEKLSHPTMGITAMKSKKSSCSTSPTRKYVCPNCCNVTKVDMGTQTELDNKPGGGELKLVLLTGESSV